MINQKKSHWSLSLSASALEVVKVSRSSRSCMCALQRLQISWNRDYSCFIFKTREPYNGVAVRNHFLFHNNKLFRLSKFQLFAIESLQVITCLKKKGRNPIKKRIWLLLKEAQVGRSQQSLESVLTSTRWYQVVPGGTAIPLLIRTNYWNFSSLFCCDACMP